MKIQAVKGTKDFYPEEKQIQNYIFNIWKSIALSYGFKEIDTPVLEPVEIYKKSGEEIPEQLFSFKDKSDRNIALRPETTPSIARMIASKNLTKPIKWFSISECFRYESPQKGREREFTQFNLDILGTKNMLADAEVISTAIKIMLSFKLTNKDFFVRISNRKLMQSILLSFGLKESQLKIIYRLIDKICKISEKDFKLTLKEYKLTDKQIKDVLNLLKLKDLKGIEKYKLDEKGKEGLAELKELFSYLKTFNLDKYCRLDLSIMRGFDYYTSTVFEVFDAEGEFRAIAGGGRYDNLLELFDAEPCPGVGYGMGDIVLTLFLKERNKLPEIKKEIDYYIAPINEKLYKNAIEIAEKLRAEGNSVEIDLMSRNLGKQFNYANSINAKKVIIIGERDFPKVTIRDMKTGKEEKKKI